MATSTIKRPEDVRIPENWNFMHQLISSGGTLTFTFIENQAQHGFIIFSPRVNGKATIINYGKSATDTVIRYAVTIDGENLGVSYPGGLALEVTNNTSRVAYIEIWSIMGDLPTIT